MNIKKKISFFALFLISSFFIVGEVKGDTYYRYGETGGMGIYSTATSGLESTLTSSYYAYRFTFVKSDGSIVSGTKPVDIYFTGNPINYGTYYKTYKFSDKTYDISTKIVNINKCSTDRYPDECYMSNIISYYKNNTSTFKSQLLGLTGNKKFDDGEFLVVEKLYTINVKTATLKPISRGTACDAKNKELAKDLGLDCNLQNANWSQPVAYEFDNIQNNYYTGTGLNLLNFLKDIDSGQKSGKLGKNDLYYFGMWTDRNNDNGTAGLYFVKNNTILNSFSGDLKVNSEIDKFKKIGANTAPDFSWTANKNTLNSNIDKALSKNRGYGINIFTYEDFEDPKCTYDNHTVFDGGRDWNATEGKCCAAGTKYNSKTGKCETPAICDATNHKSLGRDYNEKYTNPEDKTHCCDAGKKYNSKRNDCETVEPECNGGNYASLKRSFNTTLGVCCLPGQNLKDGKPQMVGSCFTKDSTPTNYDYNYYCYTQSNMCSKNNVNSTINSYVTAVDNGPRSMYTKGPMVSYLSNNQSGECILNNSAYYVGMVNGTKIYCSDSLETSLSGMISNLSVKSGTFMPVSSPTITVKHNCYFTPSSNWAKEQYPTGIETIYSRLISPSINLNFMNKDYKFNGSSSSVSDKSLSIQPQKTVYGNDYYTYSFKTTYTPGYSSSLLNKFVDKKTATGSGDSFGPINGMAYNQMSKNINISIPTDAKGTYSAKYTLGSNSYSNDAINYILSNSTTTITNQYDTKKTVECGGTCKIEYSSVSLNCASTGSLIKEIFKNGYGSDLSISNTKDSCKFTMQFSVGSQAECTRAKGNLGTLKATYTKDSCTEKVSFNTKVTGADSSCSNNVTVENIDIKEDLVFRPISLSNPFPGSNGKGRSMGSPWTDDLKKTYITDRSNVYSKKPLYSITLTPSTIKQIRDYNKDTSYDDFNLICSNGEACYSIFLRNYSKIINTNKSNCYNANDRSVNAFNSCADYSKRQ